jgi:Gpi18-like mannosyltransferase
MKTPRTTSKPPVWRRVQLPSHGRHVKGRRVGVARDVVSPRVAPLALEISSEVEADHGRGAERFADLRTPIIVGLLIRFIVAPFTSLPGDVAVWWQAAAHATQGVGLYQFPGFSYPPLYGYWALLVGSVVHLFGASAGLLGSITTHVTSPLYVALGSVVTTPIGTLLFKLPMIAADLGTGWCIWRLSFKLGASTRQARSAFLWWFFNPLVIVVSAVHGQIDSIASLAIALALLAAAEETWALAGAALAFGVAVKLVPAFLFLPFVGYIVGTSAKDRYKSLVRFVSGAFIGGVILIGPVLGHNFVQDVFTRESVTGSGIGGLGLAGLLYLPALSGVLSWANVHLVDINRLILVVETLVSLGIGYWCSQGRRISALVMGSMIAMLAVLVLNPVTNPQYLLWVLPVVAVGAVGLLQGQLYFRISLGLMAVAGIGYLIGTFGWGTFLAPSARYLGWPSPASINSQLGYLGRVSGPGWLPQSIRGQIHLAVCVVALCAMAGLAVTFFKGRAPLEARPTRASAPYRRSGVYLLRVTIAILLVEAVSLLGPRLTVAPTFSAARVNVSAASSQIKVMNESRTRLRVVAFPVSSAAGVHQILFYRSQVRPDVGAVDASVVGTYQNLAAELNVVAPGVRLTMVDAQQLAAAIANGSTPKGTLIVDVSGTLPNTVWGPGGSGILVPWLEGGGLLAFAGGVPGRYSVGKGVVISTRVDGKSVLSPHVVIVHNGILLPAGVVGSIDLWQTPATRQSGWSAALGTSYVSDNVQIFSRAVIANGGAVLGRTNHGLTSEAFIPRGQGGVLVFAGNVFPSQTGLISNDLARLVATNWFSHSGYVAQKSTNASSILLRVPTKSKDSALEVVLLDSSSPTGLWTRVLK